MTMRPALPSALVAALLLAAIPAAQAATLKPYTRLAGPVVHLSDLWDGIEQDKPLGPAPAPGARITVPAAQLAAIAHDYGVDWSATAAGDRAILERPARTLTRDDVIPALRRALTGAGAGPEADLDLAGFTAPPMAADAKLDVAVGQLEYDRFSGRFSALLDITTPESPAVQVRATGRIQDMVSLPVLRRRLNPGETVAAEDVTWGRFPKNLTRGDLVRQPADIIGLAIRQPPSPNQPILLADLGREVIVRKGDPMLVTLESAGISLAARGVATEPGGLGDQIRVLNPVSQMTFAAQITAPGQAHVIPGTARPANQNMALR